MAESDKLEYTVWLISHPGTGKPIVCTEFEEAMDKWFEGFNIPRECTLKVNHEFDFKKDHAAVKEYFKKKKG